MSVTAAFTSFASNTPHHHSARLNAVRALHQASALDRRTETLAHLAVRAAYNGTDA